MPDLTLEMPSLFVLRVAVAAVWFYEGLWCKLMGGIARQLDVVTAVPKFGPKIGRSFLLALGAVEVLIAVWVLSGYYPGTCAVVQILLLLGLNLNGILWARHIIHDPAGMLVKNAAFLVLAWVAGSQR